MGNIPREANGDDWHYVAGVLREAFDLVQSGAWCEGDLARDSNGESALVYEEDACEWCASGAIMWAVGSDGDWPDNTTLESFCEQYKLPLLQEAVDYACREMVQRNKDILPHNATLEHVNDKGGYDAVLRCLQFAERYAKLHADKTVYTPPKTPQGGT